MKTNTNSPINKLQQDQTNFGLLDMNPRKIARAFCVKGSAAAKQYEEEAEIAKAILQKRTKGVHAIVIPARDYTYGRPRMDICIQGLTPKYEKSRNPLVNLLRWCRRKLEIKFKEPRAVGYTYFDGMYDFTSRLMNETDRLKKDFYGMNKPLIQPAIELAN